MIKGKKLIAIIPARKNSKGIKNKNLFKIGKHSLLERAILIAKKSKFIDEVLVSTDCKKMFNISKKHKVNLKELRPKKLAGSKVRVLDVLKEMLKSLKINPNTNIFILFPTCPLRNSDDIKKAFIKYKKYKFKKQLISISEYLPSIDVAFYLDSKNLLKNKFLDKYNKSPGNNDHGKYYYCNYAIIALKASKLVNLKKLVNEKSIYYLMPFERSIDIDEVSQLELIKQVIKK